MAEYQTFKRVLGRVEFPNAKQIARHGHSVVSIIRNLVGIEEMLRESNAGCSELPEYLYGELANGILTIDEALAVTKYSRERFERHKESSSVYKKSYLEVDRDVALLPHLLEEMEADPAVRKKKVLMFFELAHYVQRIREFDPKDLSSVWTWSFAELDYVSGLPDPQIQILSVLEAHNGIWGRYEHELIARSYSTNESQVEKAIRELEVVDSLKRHELENHVKLLEFYRFLKKNQYP